MFLAYVGRTEANMFHHISAHLPSKPLPKDGLHLEVSYLYVNSKSHKIPTPKVYNLVPNTWKVTFQVLESYLRVFDRPIQQLEP